MRLVSEGWHVGYGICPGLFFQFLRRALTCSTSDPANAAADFVLYVGEFSGDGPLAISLNDLPDAE